VSPLQSGRGFKAILDELPTGDIAAFLRSDTGTDVLDLLGMDELVIKTQESFTGRDNTKKVRYGTIGRAVRHARKPDGSGGRGYSMYFDMLPNPKLHSDVQGRLTVYLYAPDNAVKAPPVQAVDADTAALGRDLGVNMADIVDAIGAYENTSAPLETAELDAPAETTAEPVQEKKARTARPTSRKLRN